MRQVLGFMGRRQKKKWAPDEDESPAEYRGTDKTEGGEEYRGEYLNALVNGGGSGKIKVGSGKQRV